MRIRGLGRLKAAAKALARPPAPAPVVIGYMDRVTDGYFARPRPIESEVEPAMLAALFARTQAQWTRLGEVDPYWSVLTHDAFRLERMDPAAQAGFYETGRDAANLIELFETRAARSVRRGVCLELGCGVGRITRHLAAKFERVIAVDISAGNLAICREHLSALGVGNVETVLLPTVEAVEALPAFDLLYSMIVLQHNSPPVQAFVLDRLLAKARPGGGALFQAVTNLPGYAFSAADYLASADPVMEIHALPQARIMALLRKHGLTVQEVAMDAWLDAYGSNTMFATKPG